MKQQSNTYWSVKKTILATLSVLLITLASCNRDPEFGLEPVIEFENIFFETRTEIIGGGPAVIDQFPVFLRFQDGDGDLGFSQDDLTDPRYESLIDTTILNQDTSFSIRNFNVTLFKKNGEDYEEIQGFIELGGSFQPLIDTDQVGPIEGTLRHNIALNRSSLFANTIIEANDTVRFDIFIIDRELNRSNTVTTTDVIVPPIDN